MRLFSVRKPFYDFVTGVAGLPIYGTGQKKRNRDVMTCHDKLLPSPDGRSSRLWCKNRSQLVTLGIIHENTCVHTYVRPLRDLRDRKLRKCVRVRKIAEAASQSRPASRSRVLYSAYGYVRIVQRCGSCLCCLRWRAM